MYVYRNKFSKSQLVDIVLGHPEVVWPARVCKYNTPILLSAKHLRKAILGGYGYGRKAYLNTCETCGRNN